MRASSAMPPHAPVERHTKAPIKEPTSRRVEVMPIVKSEQRAKRAGHCDQHGTSHFDEDPCGWQPAESARIHLRTVVSRVHDVVEYTLRRTDYARESLRA